MKKGINVWTFPDTMTLEEMARVSKDAGFDGIEYSINNTGELTTETSESKIIEIRNMTKDTGLEICSLASLLPWEYPLTSNDPDKRRKCLDIIKKQIDMAALLGADTILVVPGYVHVSFIENSEVIDYDLAYDRTLEGISKVIKHAEDCKINIGLENCWNMFLLSPLEFRDLIDKIGSPNLGAYFDVGNVRVTGFPEQWIKILNKRIKRVHFKDYRTAAGGFHGFVNLLEGDVDYLSVMKALKNVGYDDYCVFENIPPRKYHPLQLVYDTSAVMDRIFAK